MTFRILLPLLALLAYAGCAEATTTDAPPAGGWHFATLVPAAPAPYEAAVNRQLFDKFGHGGHGRNLYCAGPAILKFQLLPTGQVTGVALLRRSLPGLDAHLVARISNMRFPRFEPGMPQTPYTVVYRYEVWPLARSFLKAQTNCR